MRPIPKKILRGSDGKNYDFACQKLVASICKYLVPRPATPRQASRLKTGLGLREMARRLGISHVYLRDLELGRRSWAGDLLARYDRELKKPNVGVHA